MQYKWKMKLFECAFRMGIILSVAGSRLCCFSYTRPNTGVTRPLSIAIEADPDRNSLPRLAPFCRLGNKTNRDREIRSGSGSIATKRASCDTRITSLPIELPLKVSVSQQKSSISLASLPYLSRHGKTTKRTAGAVVVERKRCCARHDPGSRGVT